MTTKLSAAPIFAEAAVNQTAAILRQVIPRFEAELKQSGVRYDVRPGSTDVSPAYFSPFLYNPGHGKPTYLNTMFVNEAGRTAAEIEVSKRHEGAHAILWSKLAAAHASPYNMASPIVLCPRDWGRLFRNSERAAMTFNSLLGFADADPAIREALGKEPGTAEDFAAAMAANSGNIEVALNRVARECFEKSSNFYMLPTGKRTEKEALTLRNYYTWYSLRKFEDSNRFTMDYLMADLPPPIFVRLDDEDILQMGQLLGLSAFGGERPDSFFSEQAPLMWKHQRWQESINYKMEIFNSDDLPTVREALRRYFGVTPEEYLEFSKNYKQGDAPLPQISPLETRVIPFPTYK